jgi:hypothetical protein
VGVINVRKGMGWEAGCMIKGHVDGRASSNI